MLQMQKCVLALDSSGLVEVLRGEGVSRLSLTRLDQLFTKALQAVSFSQVVVVLKSLLVLLEERAELEKLLDHGLTATVVSWFEAIYELLTSDPPRGSTLLLHLTEEFFNCFLLLGQASLPVSQLSVVLLQLTHFTLETEIPFPLRLEAIWTLNSILESLSRDQRRVIQTHIPTHLLPQMAAAVLTCGDYEMQVSLSEALCRLTPARKRQQRANGWFSCRDTNAFCDIRDGDFEVDCRRFLNFVNSNQGDQRRVFSFPCLRAFIDSTELFRPKDKNLDEFWIDFNLSSTCISFFIDQAEGFLWGSVHLLSGNVHHFSLWIKPDGCTGPETVLRVHLKNPIMHLDSRAHTVVLTFTSGLHQDIEQAAGRVFQQVNSPPLLEAPGVVVPVSGRRCYTRKKRKKSRLKVLPLSSPSCVDDSPAKKTNSHRLITLLTTTGQSQPTTLQPGLSQSATSQAAHQTGSEEQEAELQEEVMEEFGRSYSPMRSEVFRCDRKRLMQDSGYLSDQTEGLWTQKRRAEPDEEWEEPHSPEPDSPEGVETVERVEPLEKVGPINGAGLCLDEVEFPGEGAWSVTESEAGPNSHLPPNITTAFNTFKTHLDQHFTSCWQNIEAEAHQCLRESQQHLSSLLSAVHQHRLVLLESSQSSISGQLICLQENLLRLNNMETQIMTFLQDEKQRLASFCDQHLHRLKTLGGAESGAEHQSGQ